MSELIVEAGRTYVDGEGGEHTLSPYSDEPHSRFRFKDDYGNLYTRNGERPDWAQQSDNLVALAPKQETATMINSIDHLFEVVPATRKFVGGEVVDGVRITNGGKVGGRRNLRIALDSGGYVYLSPSEATTVGAALIAAAQAIEGESK